MNWKFWRLKKVQGEAASGDQAPNDGLRERAKTEASRKNVYIAFGIALLVGLIALWIFAYAQGDFLQYSGTGMMIAGAAFFIGVILGFLFGIPYTVHQTTPAPVSQNAQAPVSGKSDAPRDPAQESRQSAATGSDYRVNTNLEQISDWLTKILVGIGLTQLVKAPPEFWKLSGLLAGALGGQTPLTTAFSLAIVVYFSICGFLLGYIWTRVYLTPEFMRVDPSRVLAELDRQKQVLNQNKQEIAAGMNQLSRQVEEVKKANYVTLDILKARDLWTEIEAKHAKGEAIDQARVEQTIAKLQRYAEEDPFNRILHIVLANLYYEVGEFQTAVGTLEKFIKSREEANQAQDDDVATAWFNLACYYAESAVAANEANEKDRLVNKAAEMLEQSFVVAMKAGDKIFSFHAKRAEEDPDLAIIRERKLLAQLIDKVKQVTNLSQNKGK